MSLQLHSLRVNSVFTLLIAASAGVLADPSVSSVEGDFQEGGEIKISGSGFTDAQAVPVLYDRLDNQPVIANLSDGSVVPEDSGPWTHNPEDYGEKITVLRSGDLRSERANAVYHGKKRSYLGWPRALDNKSNRSLYLSWWFKPSDSIDNGGSNKFVRIWDQSDGNGTRISWTQMHMTFNDINGSSPDWGNTLPTPNAWNHMEVFVDADQNLIETWLNGNRVHDISTFQKASTSEGLNIGLIGFDPSIGDNYSNLSFRMTDIYVSLSQARVELSDSSKYDPTSHREVLNVTDWSNNSITADMNLFAFDSLGGLYLYVIDRNGNANQTGFPVCAKCPGRPKSLTVE
ncbi:hypothetical protein EZI54_17070 [Marinobacter halodurans]|uniref:LamG domain-containing protein n=1 Tax=Marinobacter halodurans TaxID=2528979 RepID=A0ABY1ZKN3_9GAMM|nr:hypothetical protein [Marinobacter halodurans]TBW51584.1 hypothetical protein EZI54_17070 [Marinobacter halodurans]